MGVPKLYNWVRLRYPLAHTSFSVGEIPVIDNLYVDLNDLIHVLIGRIPKRKPHSLDYRLRRFFKELDMMVTKLKPRKLIYLAVDGAAPLAKLSLQRSRRFATARREVRRVLSSEVTNHHMGSTIEPNTMNEEDIDEEEEVLLEEEEDIEEEEPAETLIDCNIPLSQIPENLQFSSSWITPGTPFMRELSQMINDHITKKLNGPHDTNRWWQIPNIIYSGPEVPGEGEHKIIDYIRNYKDQDSKIQETTHCLFGNDADLVLLGLAQHVPNIICLRKAEPSTRKSKKSKSGGPVYEGLFITVLKECLIKELYFKPSKFPINPQYLVDDVILLLSLLGNDFLPQLRRFTFDSKTPHKLLETYIYYLEYGSGHMNPNGHINFDHLRTFLRFYPKSIKDHDDCPVTRGLLHQLKAVTGPTGNCLIQNPLDFLHTQLLYTKLPTATFTPQILPNYTTPPPFKKTKVTVPFINNLQQGILVTKTSEEVIISDPIPGFNPSLELNTEELSSSHAHHYLEGLQWVMSYYYRGLPDWNWSYGNHQSIYFTEILSTRVHRFQFKLGTPLPPYGVLLATLPPSHASLLPKGLQRLMREDDSPLKEIYHLQSPGLVNTELIRTQLQKCTPNLTEMELGLNRWGEPRKPVQNDGVWSLQPTSSLVEGELTGYPFPYRALANGYKYLSSVFTTNLPHGATDTIAKGTQRLLINDPFSHLPPQTLAEFLLGKENVLVHWPTTVQGHIVGLSNPTTRWSLKNRKVIRRNLTVPERTLWQTQMEQCLSKYRDQIQLGSIQLFIHYLIRNPTSCSNCQLPSENIAPIQTMISHPTPDKHPYLKWGPHHNEEGCWLCKSNANTTGLSQNCLIDYPIHL